jgi:hypothetical protein
MEVRLAIDELHFSLDHITAEEDLLGVITDRLTLLRSFYPSHPDSFTPSDIEFLRSLGIISVHLRAFGELKEELVSVRSLKEYEDVVSRLVRVKGALARLPVAKRVAKEIRGLNERLPVIRQQDEAQRQSRLNARILDLQQKPRRCKHRHSMMIRQGTHGYFWGCSRYPFCSATAQLAPEESDLLNS